MPKCEYCGIEYILPKSNKWRKDQRFCSRSCSMFWHWTQPEFKVKTIHSQTEETKRKLSLASINQHRRCPPDVEKARRAKISHRVREVFAERPELREGCREHRLHQILPQKDTSIEVKMQELLDEEGISYVTHYPFHDGIATQIDLAIPDKKIAIYCDGDYWHNLPSYIERDNRASGVLKQHGWVVLRFWQHEIDHSIDDCLSRIKAVL